MGRQRLPAVSRLADPDRRRLGERRVFTAGIAAFGAFSLACALAPSISMLVAARALQGAAWGHLQH
jgi:MFS family permease